MFCETPDEPAGVELNVTPFASTVALPKLAMLRLGKPIKSYSTPSDQAADNACSMPRPTVQPQNVVLVLFDVMSGPAKPARSLLIAISIWLLARATPALP